MLTDVLSPEECLEILASAEAVGFKPDEPVAADQSKSVLAHVGGVNPVLVEIVL